MTWPLSERSSMACDNRFGVAENEPCATTPRRIAEKTASLALRTIYNRDALAVPSEDNNDVPQDFFKGDTRALARAISLVENRSNESSALLQKLFPHTGHARTMGITGSPGAGKSSLVDRL